MDSNLNKFFTQLNLDDIYIEKFKDSKILSIIYKKSLKKFIINVSINKILDPKITSFIDELIQNKNLNYEVIYHVGDKESINNLAINAYYLSFILKKFKGAPALDGLKKIKLIQNENNIEITCTKSQQIILEEVKDSLLQYFVSRGINLSLSIKSNEVDVEKVIEELDEAKERIVQKELEKARQIAIEQTETKTEKVETIKKSKFSYDEVKICDLRADDQNVSISGRVFNIVKTQIRNNKYIYEFYITDDTDSISAKIFEGARFSKENLDKIKIGTYVNFKGNMTYDRFSNDEVFSPNQLTILETPMDKIRVDSEPIKRVELHLHTIMSAMDATNTITDYCKQAAKWGHTAIALTDHGCIQAFPEAQKAEKETNIKIIYGTEAYMVDDHFTCVFNPKDILLDNAKYVVLDFETTGLSNKYDDIIEFGGVRVEEGMVVDSLQTFINPKRKLSAFTTNLTGITDKDVMNAPTIEQALKTIKNFIGDAIIVAHNAEFDIGMLNAALIKNGHEPLKNPVIDTLSLARTIYPNLRKYTLGYICHQLNVDYNEDEAHRADYDARVTSEAFLHMIHHLDEKFKVTNLKDIDSIEQPNTIKMARPKHVTILAKDEIGFKNLFKIISFSNVDYIADVPRLPRSILEEYREGLIIGSACLNGEIFDLMTRESDERVQEAIKFYDYIEVQPLSNYTWLVDTHRIESMDAVKRTILDIIKNAEIVGKDVVATGDVHYLNPEDKIYRDVYINAEAVGQRKHPLFDYRGRVKENPDQYFRTTDEMLKEFEFLGVDKAYEIVVTNSNKIANLTVPLKPVKDKLNTPRIDGVNDMLRDMVYANAHKFYGEKLPEIVEARIEKELKSIIGNGYAVIYYIAKELVKKSNEDGFLVGSRGSVGSSFVATMAGITEVNPLEPHYLCENPDCCYSEFNLSNDILSGFDLEDKICPKCGHIMKGNGHNIPFETFLGFKGDKVPDIDLNFSGDYQPRAHEFTRTLLGEKNVYRAGTILTVAEKTAIGYTRKYFEDKGIVARNAEIKRIAKGCEGVKRTTGQHAGGIIVIPDYMDVYDVTPLQYPADDPDKSWMTSHFDFHAIHDEILKLDILGHVDPTAIRMLQDLTGIDPKTIPLNDEKVLSLFTSPDVLGVNSNQVLNPTGTAGIPEFGTDFTKKMVDEAHPRKFSELVQISGLSHGTDVWTNNAQDLIKNGICDIRSVIGCRDDIMAYLMKMGLEPSDAFTIMESVRKGKGLKEDMKAKMRAHNVPEWYLDSCLKIKYMFPKAHAVAYVMMALRVAWFKVYYPLEYYATYFSTRCDAFDIYTLLGGYEAIRDKILEIRDKKSKHDLSLKKKDEDLVDLFDVALEMTARGFTFSNIDIDKSESKRFVVDHDTNSLIPPFICIDGLGDSVGDSIVEARKNGPFLSKEEILKRTQLSLTCFKTLEQLGVFKDLNEENQLQFNLF